MRWIAAHNRARFIFEMTFDDLSLLENRRARLRTLACYCHAIISYFDRKTYPNDRHERFARNRYPFVRFPKAVLKRASSVRQSAGPTVALD